MKHYPALLLVVFVFFSCQKTTDNKPISSTETDTLTVFFINDQHGHLNSFAKIKHIVDLEKAKKDEVLLVCAGDIFSGNPIVDQYSEKGYPMIDIMNKTGFDITVLGNHEFDYGVDVLKQRMEQASFKWVCANVDMQASGVPQPNAFETLSAGDLKITFLGLVETNGKPDDIIPSTHPWKVSKLKFQTFETAVSDYADLKSTEKSDVYIALTHLGSSSDKSLAEGYPYFDAIIGGHSHEVINTVIGDIPVVQAGAYLSLLGRLDIIVKNGDILNQEVSFINLESYDSYDESLTETISTYNNTPEFDEIVGFAETDHNKTEVGCFFTDALLGYMNVDFAIQNGGGIRSDIDQGDITTLEIYNMDPFNNQSVIFTMTVAEIKAFFKDTGASFHVSGIAIENGSNGFIIKDKSGNELSDDKVLTLGVNDYIPAVYEKYFPLEKANIQQLTTAETIIGYLKTIDNTLDYEGCNQYFEN